MTDVEISFEPSWDLAISVVGLSDPVLARVTLDDAGDQLTIAVDLPNVPDIPEGKLACVCAKPVSILRKDTIVQEIEMEGGVRLLVPDAVALQDVAALIVTGYQLIHPRDYHAYYRARADFFKDNNFESLPEIT